MRKQILHSMLLLSLSGTLNAQSGGDFSITSRVVAAGAGVSSVGDFSIGGTIGQSVAGGASIAAGYGGSSGFWAPGIVPTSALVAVGGRGMTPDGNGLRNAIVTMIDSSGDVRRTLTGSFGYFRFDEMTTGETYVIAVASKRYQFTARLLTVGEEVTDVDFIPE